MLGVVRLLQPVHGYDVRRMLLSWRADEWASVNPGSIYHALKSLTREGQFRAVDGLTEGTRPAKTAYELTEPGEFDFFVLLRESLWKVGDPTLLRAGLCFFPLLERDELLSIMRNRLAQLTAAIDSTEFMIADKVSPPHVVEQLHLSVAQLAGEARWARDLIGRLERGDYHRTPS